MPRRILWPTRTADATGFCRGRIGCADLNHPNPVWRINAVPLILRFAWCGCGDEGWATPVVADANRMWRCGEH